jgi:hypothetical protein
MLRVRTHTYAHSTCARVVKLSFAHWYEYSAAISHIVSIDGWKSVPTHTSKAKVGRLAGSAHSRA